MPLQDDETEEDDADSLDSTSEDDDDTNDESIELTAIEDQVAQNNVKVREEMRKKGGKASKIFDDNEVATLFIPRKIRLNTENSRIAVRVLDQNASGYKLLTRHALLKGRFPGSELNKVNAMVSKLLGQQIPLMAPMENGKAISKALTEVIQLENGRPSISALQKGKRQARKGSRKGKGKGKCKEVAQVESSISGIEDNGGEVVIVSDNEFHGFDSSSQEYHSFCEDENLENQDGDHDSHDLPPHLHHEGDSQYENEIHLHSTPIQQSS